ncbi:hypothetical protein AHAS_Ahas11G0272400 [Arachis hypogaea]
MYPTYGWWPELLRLTCWIKGAADPSSSSGTTALANERPLPIATTTPSRQEPQIHMMPTPGMPKSCTQQANESSNTASHGVQSDPAIVAPNRAEFCGERQTTSNGIQDTQGLLHHIRQIAAVMARISSGF